VEQQPDLIRNLALSRVVINFREARFTSTTLLAVLLNFARRVIAAEGQLSSCCVAEDFRTIFRITRFDHNFQIYPDESAALDSF
jgi:anti-anti-sigma factor